MPISKVELIYEKPKGVDEVRVWLNNQPELQELGWVWAVDRSSMTVSWVRDEKVDFRVMFPNINFCRIRWHYFEDE